MHIFRSRDLHVIKASVDARHVADTSAALPLHTDLPQYSYVPGVSYLSDIVELYPWGKLHTDLPQYSYVPGVSYILTCPSTAMSLG